MPIFIYYLYRRLRCSLYQHRLFHINAGRRCPFSPQRRDYLWSPLPRHSAACRIRESHTDSIYYDARGSAYFAETPSRLDEFIFPAARRRAFHYDFCAFSPEISKAWLRHRRLLPGADIHFSIHVLLAQWPLLCTSVISRRVSTSKLLRLIAY